MSNVVGLNQYLTSIIMSFRDFFSLYFCSSYKWSYLSTMKTLNTCSLRQCQKTTKISASFSWESYFRYYRSSCLFYWYRFVKRSIMYCWKKIFLKVSHFHWKVLAAIRYYQGHPKNFRVCWSPFFFLKSPLNSRISYLIFSFPPSFLFKY